MVEYKYGEHANQKIGGNDMAYYLKDLPFTEEGKKLNLSDEDRERFRLVYKREGEGWVLHDIFEEGGEYGDDCVVVPLESSYMGRKTFPQGQIFANVYGSTFDTNIPFGIGSWIKLWECVYQIVNNVAPPVRRCCTDGSIYHAGQAGAQFYNCNNYIVGGHVICDQQAKVPAYGSTVYIVPICNAHNRVNGNLHGGDPNWYMKTGMQVLAVGLSYTPNYQIHSYLAQHPLESHEKI